MKLFKIPNLFTLGNLTAGCLSVLYLSGFFGIDISDAVIPVLILMLVSLVLDLFDGMVARALKINSEIGIQLDSLADMVSFGLVPGLMMLQILKSNLDSISNPIIFIGLLITLFSALRLAKFNVDTEQSSYFKGLATPANTIMIYSLFWIQSQNGYVFSQNQNIDLVFLLITTLLSSFLLISNVPLFSFKFKNMSWSENYYKYTFLIISLLLFIILQLKAIIFIIPIYIIISILFRKKIINA